MYIMPYRTKLLWLIDNIVQSVLTMQITAIYFIHLYNIMLRSLNNLYALVSHIVVVARKFLSNGLAYVVVNLRRKKFAPKPIIIQRVNLLVCLLRRATTVSCIVYCAPTSTVYQTIKNNTYK